MALRTPARPRPQGGFPLEAWLREHGIAAYGVIHVGAHLGEELEDYLAAGFGNVLFLEANPELFADLQAHLDFWRGWLDAFAVRFGLARKPRLGALLGAAAERDGHAYLYLAQSPLSSLLRPLDPTIQVRGGAEVPSFTLPTAVRTAGYRDADFNCLVIDAQGAELRVLEGAGALLDRIELLVVEVNYSERYRSCPTPGDVERFVRTCGFELIASSRLRPDHPVGDRYFQRRPAR